MKIYTKISGFGHFLPKKILSNEDLKKLVDTSDEWIYSRTGIKQRHIAEDSELTSNLAINAALSAFKDSTGMKYSKYNLEFFGLCKKCK